jgi:hypothetical protein
MKRTINLRRLHMGCGESLRVGPLRPLCEQPHQRCRPGRHLCTARLGKDRK